jgi:kumamolisin
MAHQGLPGSKRNPYRGAKATGKADPGDVLEVTVLVRRRHASEMAGIAVAGREATPMSRQAFAERYGASDDDLAAVTGFAEQQGLSVVLSHAGRRTVRLSGTVAQFNTAFGVDLQHFAYDGGSYRGRTGVIVLPPALQGVVEAVLGLDDRPVAKPFFHIASDDASSGGGSFTPVQVASLYGFPAGTGAGQCIALIELGGGYSDDDLATYFSGLGISPAPSVVAVGVDGGANQPSGDPDSADGEVLLDIEVSGAVAPGARIAVYFAPNTDAGFIDAVTTAAHDTTNAPSIISISWGGPESSWTQQSIDAMDSAFQAASAMGITVLVASGDSGSSDGESGNNVNFPASSPNCTACGGTDLVAKGTAIRTETVWDDLAAGGGATGGGASAVFPLPAWQANLNLTASDGTVSALAARGVPDIAGDAAPGTGYKVLVDGQSIVVGGTSAVAPLWAGLVARINAASGKAAGAINPVLYANAAALNDIVSGNNGSYAAAPGWDACTGLGSPDGAKLAGVL